MSTTRERLSVIRVRDYVADTTTLDVVLSLFRPSGEFDGWVLPRASIACVWVLEREMASVAAHGHLSAGAR